MPEADFASQRDMLIWSELRNSGIRDERVLHAMAQVPREEFVPKKLRDFAYLNRPLPIGCEQTISQPLIVALMTEALTLSPTDRVLEIGTGSGYAAAVLSKLTRDVFTVERIADLADAAAQRLQQLGYDNVHVRTANGTLGWPEKGPFDAIVVTAGAPHAPPALLEQLTIGGRMVIPIGECPESQRLIRMVRRGQADFHQEDLGGVLFVPLIGAAGWPEERADSECYA